MVVWCGGALTLVAPLARVPMGRRAQHREHVATTVRGSQLASAREHSVQFLFVDVSRESHVDTDGERRSSTGEKGPWCLYYEITRDPPKITTGPRWVPW